MLASMVHGATGSTLGKAVLKLLVLRAMLGSTIAPETLLALEGSAKGLWSMRVNMSVSPPGCRQQVLTVKFTHRALSSL